MQDGAQYASKASGKFGQHGPSFKGRPSWISENQEPRAEFEPRRALRRFSLVSIAFAMTFQLHCLHLEGHQPTIISKTSMHRAHGVCVYYMLQLSYERQQCKPSEHEGGRT